MKESFEVVKVIEAHDGEILSFDYFQSRAGEQPPSSGLG